MGLTKKILFGNDPAYDRIRQAWREAAAKRIAAFPFAIQTKRKNKLGRGPYWDPFWPSAVAAGLNELGVKSIIINGRFCVRTSEQARAVHERAEAIHKKSVVEWESRRHKP